MSRLFIIFSLFLFTSVGIIAFLKEKKKPPLSQSHSYSIPVESREITAAEPPILPILPITPEKQEKKQREGEETDRIAEFFNREGPRLPIVETITYKSHVPWCKGKPAWLFDYANHYKTSLDFISRSLNKNLQKASSIFEGDRFNILKLDKPFCFYLLVDTTECKLWFYYIDLEKKAKVLLKVFKVGLGKPDPSSPSGLLTPWGIYTLGNRTATYQTNSKGFYKGNKINMISVFGSRWIPFDKALKNCTAPAKSFGIHGNPWEEKKGVFIENISGIGHHISDGCIRLNESDITTLFAIIAAPRTTLIELVPDVSMSTKVEEIIDLLSENEIIK